MARPSRDKHRTSAREADAAPRAFRLRLAGYAAAAGIALAVLAAIVGRAPRGEVRDDAGGGAAAEKGAGVVSISLPTTPLETTGQQIEEEGDALCAQLRAEFPRWPNAAHAAALYYLERTQTAKAEQLWQECVELSAAHLGAHTGLGEIALSRGEYGLAAERARLALARGCVCAAVYRQLGSALEQAGKLTEAEEVLQRSVREFPAASELWVLLGKTQLQLDKLAEAEKSLRKSIELAADQTEPEFLLSTICARLDRQDEAAAHRKRWTELRTKHIAAGRETSDARYHLSVLAHLRRITSTLYCQAGMVYIENRRASRAEELLLRGLALDPENPEGCRMLCEFLLSQRRIADARAVCVRLTEIEPENHLNHVHAANLSGQLGDAASAEASLNAAVRLQPDAAAVHLSLAQLYLNTGRPAEARQAAGRAIRQAPTAEAYRALAAACEGLGDRDGAAAAADRARRMTLQRPPSGQRPQR